MGREHYSPFKMRTGRAGAGLLRSHTASSEKADICAACSTSRHAFSRCGNGSGSMCDLLPYAAHLEMKDVLGQLGRAEGPTQGSEVKSRECHWHMGLAARTAS